MTEARRKIYVPWHRRLEARVLIAGVTVSGFCLMAVLLAAVELVSRYGLHKADEQITSAKAGFDQLLVNRSTFFHTQLRLVTELPTFLALLNNSEISSHEPTMSAMAEHYRAELRAQACVISDVAGHQLGKSELEETRKLPLDLRSLAGTDASEPSIIPLDGKLFLIVSQPAVYAEENLGMMTAAFPLNDAVALELAKLTRTEVSFLSTGRVVSTSLNLPVRSHIEAMLTATPDHPFESLKGVNRFGPGQYVAAVYPLPTIDGKRAGALLLMDDWQPTGKLISDLRSTLFWIAVGTFGLAIAGMVVFSRTVARHLGDVALAARDISAGDWHRRVPITGSAEAVLVAEAFNDMTDSLVHWHNEAEIRLNNLQAAYERFSAVTQSASDAIVSINHAGAITLWNPAAERLFGYSEIEVGSQRFHELIGADGGSVYQNCVERLRNPNPDDENGVACEIQAVAKDGRRLVVDLSLAPLGTGEKMGLIAVMRDATVRLEVQRHLQAAREAAENASRNKSTFVANMSHELRTPLNAIIGYSEMMYDDAQDLDNTQTKDLAKIISAARQLLAIINDILDFSKIEAGRMTISIASFDVEDLLREVATTASPLIAKNNNQFDIVTDKPGTLVADRIRVQQVLLNLLSNAAKFTSDGTIQLYVRRDGDACIFEVRDTGIGVSEDDIGRLFRDFSQVDTSSARRYTGTGLGLAISRQICRLMGGDLTVQSTLGKGSTFTALIPGHVKNDETDDAGSDSEIVDSPIGTGSHR
jgi:PAS domain S-box-containing protein